jgi:hypothetical protein
LGAAAGAGAGADEWLAVGWGAALLVDSVLQLASAPMSTAPADIRIRRQDCMTCRLRGGCGPR